MNLACAQVLFRGGYYYEHQPNLRMENGSTSWPQQTPVIRVGSRSGAPGSRRMGVFDLEWLAPVLDGAHERGISVILGMLTRRPALCPKLS